MTPSPDAAPSELLLIIAGAKGAVASTVAAAAAVLAKEPEALLPSLTTADKFACLGPSQAIRIAGWDRNTGSMTEAIARHGVLPDNLWARHGRELDDLLILQAPDPASDLRSQVKRLGEDIRTFRNLHPQCRPIFVNLLPASACQNLSKCSSLAHLYTDCVNAAFPDMAYTLAAIMSGVPVVNFSSNEVEIPLILREAADVGVPMCGRDGKTGQTYLKVVLASALKARNLFIDGWYSLNILGNADGENLADPVRAAGKLRNKTELLDEILGYRVGERYGAPAHKVHIDYYPPRGDAKESWDAIDFTGLFGLPMSLRLNLQGRDSILAAPLVLDLARWMAALQRAGRSGPVPELAFFFKKPVGDGAPVTFQEQVHALTELERLCERTPL